MKSMENNNQEYSHRGLGTSLCMYLFWGRWPVLQRGTERDMSEQSKTDGSGLFTPRMIHHETCCKKNQELEKETKRSPRSRVARSSTDPRKSATYLSDRWK